MTGNANAAPPGNEHALRSLRLLSRFRSWLRATLFHARTEREMDAELRFHMEVYAEDLMRGSVPRDEAFRRARLEFGGIESAKDQCRDVRGVSFLETLVQDLGFGARILRKNPGFAAVAILTLALGIGATTAIFTVVHAVLLSPLPYTNPQELVTWRSNESLPDVDDIRAQSADFFTSGGGVNPEIVTYTGGTEPLGIHAGYADAGFFQVLGVQPILGRTFAPDEDRFGSPRTVVITHRFWRDLLAVDPNIIGKPLRLDDHSYTVIGVMPASFVVPRYDLDVFLSLRVVYPEAAKYRGVHFMNTYWRLKPGVTLAQAAAGMSSIDATLAAAYPAEEKNRHTAPKLLTEAVTGDVRPALFVLSAASFFVLFIACANFAGLLMAHSAARRQEMVVRAALGGGRRRLLRQALTESVLLAALGGILALPLAQLGIRILIASKPAALARLNPISMNPTVMLFGLALSLITGLVFGVAPAASLSRPNVTDALKEGGRAVSSGPAANRFRQVLVVAEISLALVLLVGTGLLVKSFARIRSVDPGFDPSDVIAFRVELPAARYTEIPAQINFRRQLLTDLNSLPGTETAFVGDVPLNGGELTHSLAFEGRPVPPGDEPDVDTFCVMGDYFHVMRIPVLAGRALTINDAENQPLVAVINESLAREFFPNENPLDKRIRWGRETGPPRWMTIVGVVADVKQFSLAEPAVPAVFTPFAQSDEAWRRWMSVVVRMPDSSPRLIPEIKRRIWSLDARIPLNRIVSMDELLGLSLAERQFNMSLLAVFAALAVLLVAVGIYGIVSYSVSRRTHEIGIRIAVGARAPDVLKLVVSQGAKLALVGVVCGIIGALALTRLMSTLLFHVAPADPVTFAVVVLLMFSVVLVACFIPAYRAVRVDPITALRHE